MEEDTKQKSRTYLEQPRSQQLHGIIVFTMSCSPGRWRSQADSACQNVCRSTPSCQHSYHHQVASPLDRSGQIRKQNKNTHESHSLHCHPRSDTLTELIEKGWDFPKNLRGIDYEFHSDAASAHGLNRAFLEVLWTPHLSHFAQSITGGGLKLEPYVQPPLMLGCGRWERGLKSRPKPRPECSRSGLAWRL